MNTVSIKFLVQFFFICAYLSLQGKFCMCLSEDPGDFTGPGPVFVPWRRFIHRVVVKIIYCKVQDFCLLFLVVDNNSYPNSKFWTDSWLR